LSYNLFFKNKNNLNIIKNINNSKNTLKLLIIIYNKKYYFNNYINFIKLNKLLN